MPLFKTQSLKNSAVAAAILLFTSNIPTSDAHSWVEQVRRIAANGTFIGEPGYARGAISRSTPDFADEKQVYLLPPNGRAEGATILDTDKIARFGHESYTEALPQLTGAPGELIALRYQENGHVSKPDAPPNKPDNRGTVFVYATGEAADDDKLLDIHGVWNTDGTGGDKRGKLIATRNFDDGQCRQINDAPISAQRQKQFQKTADDLQGADLWCQVDVFIPEDAPADSVYTMYWVWDWPTLSPELAQASKNGVFPTQGDGVETPEVYTSAIDINIVAADDADLGEKSLFTAPGKSNIEAFAEGGDIGNMAIKDQVSNMFLVTPSGGDAPPANGGDESTAVPSVGTDSPAPSVTEAPEEDKVTVTVTVTKEEPTTLYTIVTKVADDTAAAPTPTSLGDGISDGIDELTGGPKAKPRGWGFGLF